MRLAPLALIILSTFGCANAPEVIDEPLALNVPASMRAKAIEVADTLFSLHGASVDSITYEADGRLRVVLHPGVYVQPTTFRDGRCGGGTVPIAAILRLGATTSRVFQSAAALELVEVVHSGAPFEVRTLGGTLSCGGGRGTAYYRPDSTVRL